MMSIVRIILLAVLCLSLAGSTFAGDFIRHKMEKQILLKGDEPIPDATYYPSRPGLITDSPGEIIGWTQYEYQTNCSTGDRAALGRDGCVNFSWMNGLEIDPDGSGERQVYFNCVNAQGEQTYPWAGIQISEGNRSGFTTIAVLSGDEAVVAYHRTSPIIEVFTAIDAIPCFGIFTTFPVENMLDGQVAMWPYVTVDRNDNAHIVISQPDYLGTAFGYTNSTDGGQSWRTPELVDDIATSSPVMTSSRVSDKVAIVYTRDVGQQWRGDVVYYESQDGLTWDFGSDPVNVTEYGRDGDSLWAYCDVDAVYDYNDDLHMIWDAHYATESSSYYPVWLYHYDTGSETITQMAESEAPTCDPGSWNMPIAKMSIGVQEDTDNLFAIYTYFPEGDCSAGGFSNGEIYMQYSANGGASWSVPENLTNSPSPGCNPGECDSDHWSSLAERVDDHLHIIYINDKDAGGLPQGEGGVTDNPVMYLAYPTPIIAECNYVEGDVNHNGIPLELADVVAMISNFRGILPPYYTCTCLPHDTYFPATADPNGNCVPFELNDAVTEIQAYWGNITISGCVDCPGSEGWLKDQNKDQ
jgi:hypothetical protein